MYEAFKTIYEKYSGDFLILCDHASNLIPDNINHGELGISKFEQFLTFLEACLSCLMDLRNVKTFV